MIRSARDFRPGAPANTFPAADYAKMIDAIAWAQNLRAAPPLDMPAPYTFDLRLPTGFYATLSGSSSPYSFAEQQATTGGTWQNRVLTGTSNAYEANGVSGLNGKTVWLEPGYPGDYRFQVRHVSGGGTFTTPCCSAVPGTLYATLSFTSYCPYNTPTSPITKSVTLTHSTMPQALYNGPTSTINLTSYWASGCIDLTGTTMAMCGVDQAEPFDPFHASTYGHTVYVRSIKLFLYCEIVGGRYTWNWAAMGFSDTACSTPITWYYFDAEFYTYQPYSPASGVASIVGFDNGTYTCSPFSIAPFLYNFGTSTVTS